MIVNWIMANKRTPVSANVAEEIIDTAFTAFRRGAAGASVLPQALESFREQFGPKVYLALEGPDWQDHWQREKGYVLACAKALGRRARLLADDDRRTYITAQDIDEAMRKLRGYMPVAGRWCPL
jgi:hypothetical protein